MTAQDDITIPAHITEALTAIWNGASADSVESEILEFKEDPGRLPHGDASRARAGLFEKLIDEAICLANGDAATGHIIVGVADKIPGPEAFTGTDFQPDEVVHKIFNNTKPNLRTEAAWIDFHGCRLLSIRIPEALALYTRTKGQASKRVGSSCKEMTEEERRALAMTRANPDYSNGISEKRIEDIGLSVISEARRLLKERRLRSGDSGLVPETTLGLLRELGLLTHDGKLKRAGEILLFPAEPGKVNIRHLWRPIIGADPKVSEISDPLILALPHVTRLISEFGDREIERVQLNSGQEFAIPRFPAVAIDEIVTNALIHRDWALSAPIVVDQSPRVLKVWSPGPLPPGVTPDRLLTTQSMPRNSRLMAAMRSLGLAEESSRGFDRIWAAMINSGRNVPEVITGENFVEVVLAAGKPDVAFIKSLHVLAATYGDDLIASINTLLVLWHLWRSPLVTMKQVLEATQCSRIEATELMASLCEFDIVQPVRDAEEWVLSEKARQAMGKTSTHDFASISIQEWVEGRLKAGEALVASEVAEATGLDRTDITQILRHLRTLGRAKIDPDGPSRGTGTRWIAP